MVLYGAGVSPGLAVLDSGEFLGVAQALGVAHPTGYPLYALLGQLATLFPFGYKAISINATSAAAGAGAAFFMALAAAELAQLAGFGLFARGLAAAAAGGLVLAGRTLWSVATLAEVYALNAFLWALIFWAALRFRRLGGRKEFLLFAFFAGFAVVNHMTLAIFVPAAAAVAWPGRGNLKRLAPLAFPAAALFLFAASVNLYLPLRAAQKPLLNWNAPSTLKSLYVHLTAGQYSMNFFNEDVRGFLDAIKAYPPTSLMNITPVAAFILAALPLLWLRRMKAVAVALPLYFGGHLAYCGIYDIPDIVYYYIPLTLTVVALATFGLAGAADALGRGARSRVYAARGVAAALAAAAAGWAFSQNFDFGHRREAVFTEWYVDRLTAELPYRAAFFPSGDTNTFVMWYKVYAERTRPDVALLAQVRIASRGYLASLAERYPDLVFPPEEYVLYLGGRALASGEFTPDEAVLGLSDDFILPEVIATVIADNIERRRMFWGLGDPTEKLSAYIIPYGLALEIVTEPPARAELVKRGERGVAALTGLAADVAAHGTREFEDPFEASVVAILYRALGTNLVTWGVMDPQVNLFKSFIANFPDNVNGYYNLGIIYALSGKPAEAAALFADALRLAPANEDIKKRLIQALLAAGKKETAAEVAATITGARPGEVDYITAIIYRDSGDQDKALAHFAAAEPYYRDDDIFWWEKSLAYDAAGKPSEAAEALTRAIAINPDSGSIYTARGTAFLKTGNYDAAQDDFEKAVELYPADAKAHYNLACIYGRRGEVSVALMHLDAALELNPSRYVAMARKDADLESCRRSPAFSRTLERHGG